MKTGPASAATDNETRVQSIGSRFFDNLSAETSQVTFVVNGVPVPKLRARRGRFGGMFTPDKTRRWEWCVGLAATAAMRGRLQFLSAVKVTLEFVLPIPRSWSARRVQTALDGSVFPTSKPDIDNLIKSITDACNEIVYRDDSQIVEVTARKRYSATPQVFVTICPVEAQNARR